MGQYRSKPTSTKGGWTVKTAVCTVSFTVENGRLVEFEPIQALSKHMKKRLLQDVKFSALRNTITVENGTITIPRMEVRSTALNAYISGKQMINGDFDYRLTLFVNELLLQKNRNIENPIREDKTKLFLRFTSKNGKKDVGMDSQEWGKNLEKKIQREVDEIRGARQPKEDKENKKKPLPEQKSDVKVEWED